MRPFSEALKDPESGLQMLPSKETTSNVLRKQIKHFSHSRKSICTTGLKLRRGRDIPLQWHPVIIVIARQPTKRHTPAMASRYCCDCKTAHDAIRVYKLIRMANQREVGEGEANFVASCQCMIHFMYLEAEVAAGDKICLMVGNKLGSVRVSNLVKRGSVKQTKPYVQKMQNYESWKNAKTTDNLRNNGINHHYINI